MPHWSLRSWVTRLWTLGVFVVGGGLAWYASVSNCRRIVDAAAHQECADTSGNVVFGMALSVAVFVWLVGMGLIWIIAKKPWMGPPSNEP